VKGDKVDSLAIGNDAASRNDINSLVKQENVGFIDYPALGKTNVNLKSSIQINGQTVTLQSAMQHDKGLQLLYTLINERHNFFYSATLRRQFRAIDLTTNAQTDHDDDLADDPTFNVGNTITETTPTAIGNGGLAYYQTFENLSFTLRGDENRIGNIQVVPNKTFNFSSIGYVRRYDGIVRVAPGLFTQTITNNGTTVINLTRSKVVFHELAENYWRVMGMSYEDAHRQAIADYSSGGLIRAGGVNSSADQLQSGANKVSNNDTYSYQRQ
jgi:hypothetical protein